MLVLLLVLLASSADVVFEQTTKVQAKDSPAGDGVKTRVYYSGRRMRLEAAGENGPALVLRLDDSRALRLDPAQKLAVEVDVARLRARAQDDAAMAGDLMGLHDARPKTTALKALRVAGYECRGYRISAGPTTLDVYVSDALPVGMERFAEFLEWTGAEASLGPLVASLREIQGFPLETRSRVLVLGEAQETLTRVTSVSVRPLAKDLFEVPKGYRVLKEAELQKEDAP
jgi:hypothetical protein